jgi:hypothetical protein
MPLVKQELFTFPEHINSPLFYRSWRWSIFSFLCSVLWIFVCPLWIVIVLSVHLCLSFVNCHCVVCSSLFVLCELSLCCLFIFVCSLCIFIVLSVHLRLTASDYSFDILKPFLLNCTFIFILMKNSKVHKVWMLIIKKWTSYKQVCTFCMNK